MKDKKALILCGILFLSCINFLYILWFYQCYRYLPSPFVFDKENTFMDFYNTLYWSGQDGIYTIWESVYPPINFLFLQIYQILFLDDSLGFVDGFSIRQVAGSQIFLLLAIYVISLLIAVRISFEEIVTLKMQFLVFLICLLSPAFLFAIERGNLIILSIPVLSWYAFSKSQLSRALALAMLANMKPYFAIFYIVQFLNVNTRKANKDFLFLMPVFGSIIFLISGLLINQEFYIIPLNLLGFATNSALLSPTEVLSFPSSIAAFGYFRALITEFSISPIIGYLLKAIIFIYLIKSLILIYKREVNFNDLSIFSIILITNYSISTGGYGILYYIPVMALLFKQRNYYLLSIIIFGMYIGIWDLFPLYHYSGGAMNVYLSGKVAKVDPYISLGSIIRPIANFGVLVLFYKNLEKRYLNE